MENQNQVVLFESQRGLAFCSKVAKSQEEKVELFNALENADVLLNDVVGATFELKDVYVAPYEVVNEETGESATHYKTIIWDSVGKTYVSTAYGIYQSLGRIFGAFGTPDTWEKPLKVEVYKRPTKNGKGSLLALKLVK